MTKANDRVADHPIDAQFLERWSPRSFTGEAIPETELMTLFEAARWAPSSYNSQPWRFVYARRDTPSWDGFFGLLNPFNQSWAKDAAAIIVALSKSTMLPPGKDREIPSHSHSYDAGAGWAYLALQASLSGWAAHAMVGFDMDTAFAQLQVPQGYRIEASIAIGRRGDKGLLPEAMQSREEPNGRNPIGQFVMEGRFRNDA
ncbi:nitroreductase family protein [Lichenicola cladoniae]|uniref:Nitroreductase family protein n=1 Tax=Lichenicola cladoniae TaxID=1484109 RepID=A0A6M8HPT0_9PROT|nr:nitroreductase family protein [Lichenicola cladoniae]NPD69724.1 nitroreductase family protein [Acetobacteraceae bacterium]QKE90424.1 nitroreductase family protein [Lichenicola cladoniae]